MSGVIDKVLNWNKSRFSDVIPQTIVQGSVTETVRARKKDSIAKAVAAIAADSAHCTLRSKYFKELDGKSFEYTIDGDGQCFSYYKEDMVDSFKPLVLKKDNDFLLSQVNEFIQANQEIDWSKVAEAMSIFCKFPRLPMECFSYYHNHLDPAINQAKWTQDEERKLAELASRYREHDWIVIAHRLGTARTPLQCLRHYQRTINTKLVSIADWSSEEESLLKHAVEKYGVGQWNAIARVVSGRSSQQCLMKWRRTAGIHVDDVVDGRWLEEEEKRLFLAAVAFEIPCADSLKRPRLEIEGFTAACVASGAAENAQGSQLVKVGETTTQNSSPTAILSGSAETSIDSETALPQMNKKRQRTSAGSASTDKSRIIVPWSKVAECVVSRNDSRCRDKWTCSLDPSVIMDPWTVQEDALLLALVKKWGAGRWTSISDYLPGRSDSQASSRWAQLTKKSSEKGVVSDRQCEGRKRKALVPPALGRKDAVSSLDDSDFIQVLQVDV